MATIVDRDAATMRVIEELKRLYKVKIMPLEQTYRFDLFAQPLMTDAEFDAKPQVNTHSNYYYVLYYFIREIS